MHPGMSAITTGYWSLPPAGRSGQCEDEKNPQGQLTALQRHLADWMGRNRFPGICNSEGKEILMSCQSSLCLSLPKHLALPVFLIKKKKSVSSEPLEIKDAVSGFSA